MPSLRRLVRLGVITEIEYHPASVAARSGTVLNGSPIAFPTYRC
jgi:hypothetical protein